MIIVNEVTLLDFVVSHLHATAQFRQNHYLQVFILQKYRLIGAVGLLVSDTFDDGIRIHHPARSLIHALLQENGILLVGPALIGRNHHLFSPGFTSFTPSPSPKVEGYIFFSLFHLTISCYRVYHFINRTTHSPLPLGVVSVVRLLSSSSSVFPLVSGQRCSKKT